MTTCYGCRHLAGRPHNGGTRSGDLVCVRHDPPRRVGAWNHGQEDNPVPLEDGGACYTGGYVFRLPDDPVVKRKPVIDPERAAVIRERLRRVIDRGRG